MPSSELRRERDWDEEDAGRDADGSTVGLLELGETSGDEVAVAPVRSVSRLSAAALMGAAALALVLGLSGVAGSARAHMGWGAVSSGLSVKQGGLVGSSGASGVSQTMDQQIYGSSTPAPSGPQTRYGQQVFDKNAKSLAPKENKNDGNLCGDDEEEFAGACYKKCSKLTNGTAPFRTSPFSCCKEKECSITENSIQVKMCAGYDVAGDAEGKGKCPHKEGVCLANEEMFLNVCYKKCSILTNGEYPHRKTALTCCATSNLIECLMPSNTDTSVDYSVGGGHNDGDESTPGSAHMPMKSLTEQSEST